jgi:succinate dehydrogenase / fumarate reductase cytochrome b subunit
VSTAALASHGSAASGIRHFLLRRLHSLTGLVFGGYLVVHLIINASLAESADVFGTQVDKIHSLPFLPAIEWIFIYLPILFHTVYGIYIAVAARWNVGNYPYSKNVYYVLQRVSALIIVAFMIFHVLGMKGLFGRGLEFEYGPGQAAASAARHINANWFVAFVVYPVGVLASCYHLANGFWTAAISWGLTVSKGSQRRWGYVCAGLFALTLLCGLTAWVAALRMKGTVVP